MSFDASKLTPTEEWKIEPDKLNGWPGRVYLEVGAGHAQFTPMRTAFVAPTEEDIAQTQTAAEFCLLARQAFSVMMRRGFVPTRVSPRPDAKWGVNIAYGHWGTHREEFADPFTALVEAEKWYVANIEGKDGGA